MNRDTSNQLLPAREAFQFVDLINQLWLAQHPEIPQPPKEQPKDTSRKPKLTEQI